MEAAPVRIESPGARDVTALVLEELSLSPAFRSWFLEAIALESGPPMSVSELHPIRARYPNADAESESDGSEDPFRSAVEIDLGTEPRTETDAEPGPGSETASERVRLHVTATVEALIGDGLERTLAAAGRRLEDGAGDGDRDADGNTDSEVAEAAGRTVLLAPAAALEDGGIDVEGGASETEPPVDATLSLEALRERFAARGTDRGDYRAALVAAAIDRGERAAAARATAGDRRAALVERYESLAADRDLSLELRFEPDAGADLAPVADGDHPFADGTSLSIDAPSLGADHRLVHELESGTVDLRIPAVGDRLEIFAARYAGVLPTTTTLLTAGDAVVLRQSVPAIDPSDVDSETDPDLAERIDDAVEAVGELLAVAERVRERTG